jgi:hypothetical protein
LPDMHIYAPFIIYDNQSIAAGSLQNIDTIAPLRA